MSSGPMKAIAPLSLISVIILIAWVEDDLLLGKPDAEAIPMLAAMYVSFLPGKRPRKVKSFAESVGALLE